MDSIKKLGELFSRFPTIGSRTAARFVFYLIGQPKASVDEIITAIQALKNNVKQCSFCFNPFESTGTHCSICESAARNKQLLCIVEKEADLLTIENTKRFQGLYFILGGTLGLRKTENELRIKELQERVKNSKFTEIIVALNPTPEGKATSALVERVIKETISAKGGPASGWKITHLAQGLPVGGELEYADEETLESAFEGRK